MLNLGYRTTWTDFVQAKAGANCTAKLRRLQLSVILLQAMQNGVENDRVSRNAES